MGRRGLSGDPPFLRRPVSLGLVTDALVAREAVLTVKPREGDTRRGHVSQSEELSRRASLQRMGRGFAAAEPVLGVIRSSTSSWGVPGGRERRRSGWGRSRAGRKMGRDQSPGLAGDFQAAGFGRGEWSRGAGVEGGRKTGFCCLPVLSVRPGPHTRGWDLGRSSSCGI